MKIVIETGDGRRTIAASDDYDPKRALTAHGFDPDEDEWHVED